MTQKKIFSKLKDTRQTSGDQNSLYSDQLKTERKHKITIEQISKKPLNNKNNLP